MYYFNDIFVEFYNARDRNMFHIKKGSHPATAVYPLFWAETLGVERVGSADLYCFNDIFGEFYNARDGNMFHSARGVDGRLLIQVSTFL